MNYIHASPQAHADSRSCTRKGTTLTDKTSREYDINHTRSIYRCYVQDFEYEFCENSCMSQTQRRVNAFNMSGLR